MLDYLYQYLITAIPINILEISVAISGSYFLYKNPNTLIINRYLVYFLWFTFFTEMIGKYAALAYFTNYEYLGFIKDTVFERSFWLYNIYTIISFSFFGYYFTTLLNSNKLKKRFLFINILYLIIGIINLTISDIFFKGNSVYTSIAGTILFLSIIMFFYFDLLQSDIVLDIKKHLPMYISIGVLVYFLCLTPLDIFSQYYKTVNKTYVKLRSNIFLFTNIFMYGTFIIGFIVCAKSNSNKEEILN